MASEGVERTWGYFFSYYFPGVISSAAGLSQLSGVHLVLQYTVALQPTG